MTPSVPAKVIPLYPSQRSRALTLCKRIGRRRLRLVEAEASCELT